MYSKEEYVNTEEQGSEKDLLDSKGVLWGLVAFFCVLTAALFFHRKVRHVCLDYYYLLLFYVVFFLVLLVMFFKDFDKEHHGMEWLSMLLPYGIGMACVYVGLSVSFPLDGCKVETKGGWYVLHPKPDSPEDYVISVKNNGTCYRGMTVRYFKPSLGLPAPVPELHGKGILMIPDKNTVFGRWEQNEFKEGVVFNAEGEAFIGTHDKGHYVGRTYISNGQMFDYEERNNKTIRKEPIDYCKNTYIGFFRKDSKTGYGRYYFDVGGYYEGWFKDGMCNGKGRLFNYDNQILRDKEWKMESPAGKPRTIVKALILAEQAKEGKEKENRYIRKLFRHSWPSFEGVARYGIVVSQAKDLADEMSGMFFILPDAQSPWIVSYKGKLVNRRPEGKATAIFETGDTYEGNWQNGFREGYGEMLYFNGDVYKGEWRAGRRTGKGIYFKNRNDYVKGDFVDGVPHGIAVCYINGITVYNGRWVDGKPLHPEEIDVKKMIWVPRYLITQSKNGR